MVVDTIDGLVIYWDQNCVPFTRKTAQQFADLRNKGIRPEWQDYAVYKLTPVKTR